MNEITYQTCVPLRNGSSMPLYGLGTWLSKGNSCYDAVKQALELGFRLIDTARLYENEKQVGDALKDSKIPREEVFIVTKAFSKYHQYDLVKQGLKESLECLQTDYVDLLLIHTPNGGNVLEVWRALEDLKKEGLARAIGVSNFGVEQLKQLILASNEAPEVNQIEYHLFLQQKETIDYCKENQIQMMGYCPVARGKRFGEKTILEIAAAHNVTEPQVMIRWCLQKGIVTIPKSVNPEHIQQNADCLKFSLSEEEMKILDSLENGFKASTSVDNMNIPWEQLVNRPSVQGFCINPELVTHRDSAMLAEIRARRKKDESEDAIDSDPVVDVQEVNLWGCGSGHYGRLAKGFGDADSVGQFINCKINYAVHPIRKFTQIACGAGHTLAIGEDKNVYSWGKCHFGQLGHGQQVFDRYLPRKIQNLENIIKISAQDSASFAINENGDLFSWGCGFYGALGLSCEETVCVPKRVEDPTPFKSIASGKHHSIVTSENKLFGFGMNKNGQLGLGHSLNRRQPTEIENVAFPIISVGCGDTYSFIVTNDEILLFGNDSPVRISVDFSCVEGRIIQVSCRHKTILFLSDAGKIYHFMIEKKKLYPSTRVNDELVHVACGEAHFIGASKTGKVYTWGSNNNWGKLGHDTSESPLVTTLASVFAIQVDAGSNHSFALTRE